MHDLDTDELLRYSRHFSLPNVGMEGQKRLAQAKVLCVGAGGLGSPLLLYLTAAGVGTLGIVDDDVVELSNLQRQILYNTEDLQQSKTQCAETKLKQLNPHVNIIRHNERLTKDNALNIIRQYDIIADGTDNFATRYLVNDACFHAKKPNVYASIFQFEGQCSVFTTENGPCYRCLYDAPPPAGLIPNCAEGGVFGVLPGLLGTLQATEVIKLILRIGEPLIGRLLTVDALAMRFREFQLQINPDCRLCVHHQAFESLPNHDLAACDIPLVEPDNLHSMTVHELAKLEAHNADFQLLDVREPFEYQICNLQAKLIPLGELPFRLNELDKSKLVVVHCKAGPRSERAAILLREAGFNVKFLEGGILAWINEIDPSLKVY
jgi:adenylyltransferase/sulfurtransferase